MYTNLINQVQTINRRPIITMDRDIYNEPQAPYTGSTLDLIKALNIDDEISSEIIDRFVEDMTCKNLFTIISKEKQDRIKAYIIEHYASQIIALQREGSL